MRWGDQLRCAYKDCNHDKVFKYTDGKRYKCAKCHRQYSVRVGTIFEDSKISLQKWYAAIYLITSHKKGISSLQLHRDLGVTQKTAWYMLHRVRHSLGWDSSDKLTGTIEADETFIGGKEKNKHANKRTEENQGRSLKTRSAVAGIVQRNGELRAKKVASTEGHQLRQFIYQNVELGSKVNTDEWWGYKGLGSIYDHQFIHHNANEYVNGDVHTNTLEGFWSLLKRSVFGIYHSISSKHIQKYIDESVFRYNTRGLSESGRFNEMLQNIASPISYNKLIQHDTNPSNRQMESEQGTLSF